MTKDISRSELREVPARGSVFDEAAGVEVVSADAFRRAMRGFASTVTIISTESGGRSYGMVATAVVSISIAPPLLLVAVQHRSSSHDAISRRRSFCVNVLSKDQQDVAASFLGARNKRFKQGRWAKTDGPRPDISGLPYLLDAQSVLICAVDAAVPSTTHTLFIGRVAGVENGAANSPLLYCAGVFGAVSIAGLDPPPNGEARQNPGDYHAKT